MFSLKTLPDKRLRRAAPLLTLLACGLLLAPGEASALPAFARQTGQNCVACHAGGQFPELTEYGRLFKMTGYTIGQRNIPLSVMGVASFSKVDNTTKSSGTSADDFQKDGVPLFATGSLFIAGKVTDTIGLFSQITYDNYAAQSVGADGGNGKFLGHSGADSIDLRYADRIVDANRDIIFGVSVNNKVSLADPWNTAPAWMQYVPVPSPTSSQFLDGNFGYPGYGAGENVAGVSGYLFWDKTIYAEFGTYRTANGPFSIMSAGTADGDTMKLKGSNNPYFRIAYSHDWGPHNIMVGASTAVADVFNGDAAGAAGTSLEDSSNFDHIKNYGIDAQYQYILDPHTITAQFAYMHQNTTYASNLVADQTANPGFINADGSALAAPNASDSTNTMRAKVSYVYQAKYGGALSYFDVTGTTNTANVSAGFASDGSGFTNGGVTGNLTGSPDVRGLTYEAFWIPVQYVRVGVQYTTFQRFNGAGSNYNGDGRNPGDNNSLFFYVWGAY